MRRLEADICVVGAGFAGLGAAWRLHQAGRKVVVLEARDRVGGRSFTEHLADGTHIDRGCGWLGAGHDRAYRLAAEMGIDTYPTWLRRRAHRDERRQAHPLRGSVPLRINVLQLASLALALRRLGRMAKKVPRDTPWTAKDAREWDGRTLGAWLEFGHDPRCRDGTCCDASLGDIFTSDLAEVSLLGGLHLLSSNRGFERLVNIRGGHQESRVAGGTQAILNAVHERLADAVQLSAPVREIY